MDKKALQNFALFAKDSLETQIKVSLKLLGIHSDKDIKKAYIQGDFTIIDGDSKTYPSDLKVKRDHILELIKTDGYAYTIEQFAYTWFNRLIALRFMEVHDYLSHGFKVFPKGNGSIEPEILGKLTLVEKELNLDIELCRQFKEKAQIEELYRYVLFQQCNALSGVLPMLFSKEYAYLELMLPSTLLKGTTVITELIKIDESNFLDDVEVIGWLYQFYVSSDREEFRKAKVVNKDLIPTLTQIFTPDWIVRYMTENSLGRLWLESYPDSSVKKEFKYYVEDAEQTEEVKKQIESIRYKNVDPKDIKVIEPCSGSGHILVYAFDVLMLMYEEKGYSKNDIPKLILDNNLFGLDVDKRASQLASFSLIMKARSIDSRFFQPYRISYPKVFEIKDSKMLISLDYKKKLLDLNNNDWKKDDYLSDEELKVVDYVIETFVDGKVIGSLLKVKRDNYVPLISKINHLHKVTIRGIFNGEFVEYGLKRIVQLLRLAEVMSRKYDVMITNPPYLSISDMEKSIKEFFVNNYPNSKTDMFSMFIDVNLIKISGFKSLVTPDGWQNLFTFSNLRKTIFSNHYIQNLINIPMGAFEAAVKTTSFVIRKANSKIDYKFRFGTSDFNKIDYQIETIARFDNVPNNMFLFGANPKFIDSFRYDSLEKYAFTCKGLDTCDNDTFVRFWFEVTKEKIGINITSNEDCYRHKWFPYTKGGEFRKWFGNTTQVVLWEENGKELRDFRNDKGKIKSRPQNMQFYFKKGLTYNGISSSYRAVRYMENSIFGGGGNGLFAHKDDNIYFLAALINSRFSTHFLLMMNSTLNFLVGDMMNLPVHSSLENNVELRNLSIQCINISKEDWDENEISIDFKQNPIIKKAKYHLSLNDLFTLREKELDDRLKTMTSTENRIDLIIENAYDIVDLMKDKSKSRVTIRKFSVVQEVKELISYLLGFLFGRYVIDGIDTVQNESLFLSSGLGMETALNSKLEKLVELVFGTKYFGQNIEFLANALEKNNNETARERLNRYINDEFIFDHIKAFQKRPIYWMLSSGKYGAFKCLFYIHKYNEDTLATINSQYLLPESTRLKYELNELNNQLVKADDKTRRILEKEKVVIENKYNEIIEYGQVLDHMANRYISIDLDDGVKVNYEKFQGIEIVTDSGTRIKKDLLVPIK